MGNGTIRQLISVANDLDLMGLAEEADKVDSLIKSAWGFGWMDELEENVLIKDDEGNPVSIDLQAFSSEMETTATGLREEIPETPESRYARGTNNVREFFFDLYSKVSGRWKNLQGYSEALQIVKNMAAAFGTPKPIRSESPVDGSRLGELSAERSRLNQELSSVKSSLEEIRWAIESISARYGYQARAMIEGHDKWVAFSGDIINPDGLIKDLSEIGITASQVEGHLFSID